LLAACVAFTAAHATDRNSQVTREDVEAWTDGFMSTALRTGEVPGAVVVVVKDGQVLFQKGYGYADVERRLAVDPQQTVFRVGSVSKLFTWTAVMQLVEQGKLELDRDVNEYLDFSIDAAFGKPITMRHLMTHTPGFVDTMKAAGPPDVKLLKSLGEYLKARQPRRIFPPGEVPGYSNYGVTLAGYIVERISGQRFEEYVDEHILGPLAMRSSSFHQPLPSPLAQRLAKGYKIAGAPPWYFEPINPVPAGALSATAADMARFMLALLANGELDGKRILREETARAMQEYNHSIVPPFAGMALGFQRMDRNGRRIVGHGGATAVFHCNLALYADEGVGLFIARNAGGNATAARLDDEFFERFTERYFPGGPLPELPATATAREHAQLLAGRYDGTRRFDSFLSALSVAGAGQLQLRPNPDGTLTFAGLGRPQVFREVSPFLWHEVNGPDRLTAQVKDDRVLAVRTERFPPIVVFQPVPWWKSSGWHAPMLVLSCIVLLFTVIAWPIAALVRKRFAAPPAVSGHEAVALRLVRTAGVVDLTFVAGWLVVILAGWQNIATFNPGLDPVLRLLQFLGLLAIAGVGIAVWHAWLAWRGPRGWAARAWSIVLVVACIEIVWFAFAARLMTITLDY
jgi:CubicO group peptidase (beta-lactamase class C family)